MFFHYLGHSEGILEIENPDNEPFRILLDTWLSDFSVGDLMERTPKIRIDYHTLPQLDAIYISHAHTDHLDPYTLIELYRHQSPLLILPETLTYLVPIFQKYLPTTPIKVLRNRELFTMKKIELYGIVYKNDTIGNEEDVMTLSIANTKEIAYFEVDTIPPDNEDEQRILYKLLTKRPYETVLYVATRNELEGNLKVLDYATTDERKRFEKDYRKKRIEEMEWQYEKFEYEDYAFQDIAAIPGFIRAFIGQGLQYPASANPNLANTKIMKLEEVTALENEIAKRYDRNFPQEFFRAGKSYAIKGKSSKKIGDIPSVSIIEDEKPEVVQNRFYASGPLNDEERDRKYQKELITNLLNTRFLPGMLSNQHDNLKDILLDTTDHVYRILIKFGTAQSHVTTYFSYGFGNHKFEEEIGENLPYQEDYWANDIDDFYNGKQELYCNFLHTLNEKKSYRLWTLLGNTFLNNDIVTRKHQLHFERAQHGENPRDWVLGLYETSS